MFGQSLVELVKALLNRPQKKNALSPFYIPVTVSGSIFVYSLRYPESDWIWPYTLSVFALICAGMMWAYFYFMIKNPDRLQSERFQENIKNLARQKGQDVPESLESALRELGKRFSPGIDR